MRYMRCLLSVGVVALLGACHGGGLASSQRAPGAAMAERELAPPVEGPPRAVDMHRYTPLPEVVERVADKRVIFIGERHTRLDHHLNQLEMIRQLHARDPALALGLEFFQQPFQAALDEYVAGKLTEAELIKRTEYYERWGYDFRLYAPILQFARREGIPLVALNVARELTRKVAQSGLDSLTEEERARLPQDIDRTDELYRRRLRAVFGEHEGSEARDFEHFYQAQLLWDEGMAERAAQFLRAHPQRRLIILAGSGHLAYGVGIPDRLTRRVPSPRAIVLNGWSGPLVPSVADFILLSEEQTLPPAGRLGVQLRETKQGPEVAHVLANSAAAAAGIEAGDRIVAVDNHPVVSVGDVKAGLWDKVPGDRVSVELRRHAWLFAGAPYVATVELR